MQTTELNVKGMSAKIVGFSADLRSETVVITVAVSLPSGQILGHLPLQIGPEGQVATEASEAIPAFSEFLASDADAQALFGAIQKFALKIADTYSKIIDIPTSA